MQGYRGDRGGGRVEPGDSRGGRKISERNQRAGGARATGDGGERRVEQSQEELEEEKRTMQEEMEKHRKDSAEMESKFEKARRETEERINARLKTRMGRTQEVYEAEIRKYEESLGSMSWSGTDAKTRCGPIA